MQPLQGIRVIEFCSVAAGPFCGMLLADMGADVIKVENPAGGDSMRAWPPISDGYSENFASVNRNKRSVTLDLKNPADQARARVLVDSADVVLENNRPGVMERLGLAYAAVSKQHPELVYCSISAFGQDGPRASEAGFDLTLQAMSGVMSVTGEPGGEPVKCGVPLADFATGLYGAFAISAALREVAATGHGTHIDASMLGASLAISALQTSQYFGTGENPVKLGSAHPRNAPYEAFRVADGHVAMAAGNNALFARACKAIHREDLIDEPRFGSTTRRAENQTELKAIFEGVFADKSVDTVLALFREAGVACAPINGYAEALADPQVDHMGWVQPLTLPGGHETQTFISPLRFGGENVRPYRRPPELGEHNDEVFAEFETRREAADAR
ncbi:CaiB/BaiF CoA transferase family protein [Salinisphaera hydrothermalis]|uniref:CaiB/BaiF CoA transferase family protein n=1 Tax=Salinisphaera hydrothermalis TaxID=563188 RepID=UPI003340B02C